MPYLSEAELISRVGGVERWTDLTDDNGDSEPDTEVLEMVQAELDAELNGYFRAGGYTTPLSADGFRPAKRAALDLANYRLLSRGPRTPSETDRLLYEDALKYFAMVAAGKILLIPIEESIVAEPIFQGQKQLLTLDELSPYF